MHCTMLITLNAVHLLGRESKLQTCLYSHIPLIWNNPTDVPSKNEEVYINRSKKEDILNWKISKTQLWWFDRIAVKKPEEIVQITFYNRMEHS